MKIDMNDSRMTDVSQLQKLLTGARGLDLSLRQASIADKYAFIDHTIDRLRYPRLTAREKRTVRRYLKKLTGYRKAQLFRLIQRAGRGRLQRAAYQRAHPHRLYTAVDVKLLERTDELHLRLNGLATKEILRREAEVFGHQEYQTVARVSRSHLYNLRDHPVYKSHWVNHTKPTLVPIGLTQQPENFGWPGSIRIDTVHQRDVYHVNAVDEVTQWEVVVCVPTISEQFMLPALAQIVDQYPFTVFNFHSDRGSENINYLVAELLTRLQIRQTKSRSRHPSDNALVETKNGAVIRKNMGWVHLDQGVSDRINDFYQQWFNPYLNYHRPSLFAGTTQTDGKGREQPIYDEAIVPYEKLKAVDRKLPKSCLKPGISFHQLDEIAYRYSDNEFAALMREEERKLFDTIQRLTTTKLGSHREKKGQK